MLLYISEIISFVYVASSFCFGNSITSGFLKTFLELFSKHSLNVLVISLYFLYSIILLKSSSSVNSFSSSTSFGRSVFDFKYNQAYVSLDIGDVIVSVKYVGSDRILIVGKNGIYLLNDKELSTVYTFEGDSLEYYDFYDNGLCIVTQSGADSDENNVIRFDKNGEIKTKTKLNGKARGFSATDHYCAVLFSDSVECVGYSGDITGKIDNIKYASDVTANGDCVYVLSVNSIDRFSAYSDYSVQKTEHTTGSGSLEG